MPPRRNPTDGHRRFQSATLSSGLIVGISTDDDEDAVTAGSELLRDYVNRHEAAVQDAARVEAARRLHPQQHPRRRLYQEQHLRRRLPPLSDASSTTHLHPIPSPPLLITPPSDAASTTHTPLHRQLQPPQPEPITYTPGILPPTSTLHSTVSEDARSDFQSSGIRAHPDGDGELLTDVAEISQRVADVRMEVTRSVLQARPYHRPQPPQYQRHHAVSIPDPETSRHLDSIWASCNLSLPPWCEYPYHDVSEPSETPLLEPKNTNTSSYSMQPEAVTHDIPPTPRQSSPPILACFFEGWPTQFFIRIDHGGSFHTYPRLGGPFQSLQEAESAMDSHLDDLRSPIMRTNGLLQAEIEVRHALYWPDGTRKSSSKSDPKRTTVNLLVAALLDKYNEDNHLLGDLAYELDDVVCFLEVFEREGCLLNMFYHINLTIKKRGDDGFHSSVNNVFFAEVTRIKGEVVEYVLSCLCMVEPNDNGQCYGCMRYGNVDLKHPVDADKYKGGHSSRYSRCSGFDPWRDTPGPDVPAYIQDEEERLADEEATIRKKLNCPADPPIPGKLDVARMPVVGPAKRDDAGSAKREDGKGRVKYIVPARRQLF